MTNKAKNKPELRAHQFTIPEQMIYGFALTINDKTFVQTVKGKDVEDAQSKLTSEGWKLRSSLQELKKKYGEQK